MSNIEKHTTVRLQADTEFWYEVEGYHYDIDIGDYGITLRYKELSPQEANREFSIADPEMAREIARSMLDICDAIDARNKES